MNKLYTGCLKINRDSWFKCLSNLHFLSQNLGWGHFYPWSPKVEPWVNRWTFSSPSPFPSPSSPSLSSHHQICQRPLTKTWFQRPLTIVLCTVLYCTVLYCTVLYCTVLYCTVLYVLYCTVLYCTVKKKKKKQKNIPTKKGGLNCTVDHGSCAADALLFNHSPALERHFCLFVIVISLCESGYQQW